MNDSNNKILLAAKKLCSKGSSIQINNFFANGEVLADGEYYCNFLYIVNDYSKKKDLDTGSEIKSQSFYMENNESISWNIIMYPNGDTVENKDYISVFLVPNFKTSIKVQADYSIILFNKKHLVEVNKIFSYEFEKDGIDYGWPRYLKNRTLVEKCLQDDKLIFLVCIEARVKADFTLKTITVSDIVEISTAAIAPTLDTRHETISNTWKNLYKDTTFADFTLIVDKKEVKAHKNVLAAASPVFFEILKKEASLNSIEIMDLSFGIVKEMLRFIYINKIENLHNIAHELIMAADKYGIKDLKSLCEKSLSDNINIDNIGKIILIADACDANTLLDETVKFVIKNKAAFQNHSDYEEIIDSSQKFNNKLLVSLMKI